MVRNEKNPATLAGADRAAETTKNRLFIVAKNDNSRQRWRARVQTRRVPVSRELMSFLVSMAMGGVNG